MPLEIAGPELLNVKRALISVYDKAGIVELTPALASAWRRDHFDWRHRKGAARRGLAVTDVGALTGMPEMMDGRVKTLHPSIHGGCCAPRRAGAPRRHAGHGIEAIDCLVSNLYPFEATGRAARARRRRSRTSTSADRR